MKPDNTKSGVFKKTASKRNTYPVSGTLGKRRYSNDDGLGTDYSGGSFWNSINWNNAFANLTNTISNIFGKGDKYQVLALQEINEQQRKTTVILWTVIGLMAAVGLVILIKKTK